MDFRDPDEDLPRDFAERRAENYAKLRKPLDPSEFIGQLREEMRAELAALNDTLPLPWLEIKPRPGNQGAIRLTPLDAMPELSGLGQLKKVITRQWGTVALIDVLKEVVLRSACRSTISGMAGRDALGGQLLERLLLVLYAYGTNAGIRAVAAGETRPPRGGAVLRAPPLPDPGPGPRAGHRHRQRHLRRPASGHLGRGLVRGGVGLHPLRGVRPEHLHRVALPLRRPRRADLLARGAQEHGDPLPGHQLHRQRGRRDGRGGDAPRHRDGRRGQLHRYPRPVGHRVRPDPAARLRPAAADQGDQPGPAPPSWPRRLLPEPRPGDGRPGDQVGPDRPTSTTI
jgi:hypothetical protein